MGSVKWVEKVGGVGGGGICFITILISKDLIESMLR